MYEPPESELAKGPESESRFTQTVVVCGLSLVASYVLSEAFWIGVKTIFDWSDKLYQVFMGEFYLKMLIYLLAGIPDFVVGFTASHFVYRNRYFVAVVLAIYAVAASVLATGWIDDGWYQYRLIYYFLMPVFGAYLYGKRIA